MVRNPADTSIIKRIPVMLEDIIYSVSGHIRIPMT